MATEIPLYPPVEWFTPPTDMPKDAGCIVEPNGRVYGYLCHWGSVLMDGTGDKWTAPRSRNSYAYAHTGDTQCADGVTMLKTANLGGDFGHAPQGQGDLAATQAFYENTQTQLARVRYGEDSHGVWFAGCCWPTVSEFDMAKLRASARSGHWAAVGDWRDMHSGKAGYELVGACLVNVPGLKYARADRAASGVLSFNPMAMASGADHQGAMVAVFVEPDVASKLAVEGGEPASDLHVTLAYFDAGAGDRQDWTAIHDLVANIGKKHLPLYGAVQGRGEFYADGASKVHWASPDVPGLGALREELCAALDLAGFEVRHDHGFTPHITLMYDETGDMEAPVVGKHDLSFDRLTLAVGGDMTSLAAKPTIERVASSGTVVMDTATLAAGDPAVAPVAVGGVLLQEGVATEDGRLIEAGGCVWREMPLPLYATLKNLPGHDEACLVGRIDNVWRSDSDATQVLWSGVIFPNSEDGYGQAVVDAITNEMLTGISIDGIVGPDDAYYNEDDVSVITKIVVAGATLTPMPAISTATVTLLSTTTKRFTMDPEAATDDLADATPADTPAPAADDQITALSDALAAVADRVEYLIGLVESAQMSARYEAAAARIRS